MKTYEEFKAMELRPAYYNGTVFDTEVEFNGSSAYSVDIEVAKAIKGIVGDTVSITGKVFSGEHDHTYITVYMCGDILTEFIDKFGATKINDTVCMRLEMVYAVYESSNHSVLPKEEEITAYKLIEIISD